ncbi:MAG: ABC transporter ATP-binding protein [Elusimicrobiota bacterium]|nr:ABC transporter ATP-binding protein [Elusimicrobiota bacterium]
MPYASKREAGMSVAGQVLAALVFLASPVMAAGSPLKDVKVREIMPRVYQLEFPTSRQLAGTFMRVQEHYESAEFHGKVFTKAEFLAAYAKVPHGSYSNYYDWDGFNVPASAFSRFYAGEFEPLDAAEKALLELVSKLRAEYVIGTVKGGGALRHERAHALYAMNPRYRAEARALLKTADLEGINAMLKRLAYHSSVWEDEAHAWLGAPAESLREEGLDPVPYQALHRRLLALYARYATPAAGR